MNGAIHSATSSQRRIRGIHNAVSRHFRDVPHQHTQQLSILELVFHARLALFGLVRRRYSRELQVFDQEREAFHAVKTVLAVEDFILEFFRVIENIINFLHTRKGRAARLDRENIVLIAALGK